MSSRAWKKRGRRRGIPVRRPIGVPLGKLVIDEGTARGTLVWLPQENARVIQLVELLGLPRLADPIFAPSAIVGIAAANLLEIPPCPVRVFPRLEPKLVIAWMRWRNDFHHGGFIPYLDILEAGLYVYHFRFLL
jgi:hypothetical protein